MSPQGIVRTAPDRSSGTFALPRLEREWRTVQAMIRLYCHDLHGSKTGLCRDCASLAAFARTRLVKCPYQETKPTCAHCPIHCYRGRAGERARMKHVMRYAGPRMAYRHPVLAVRHVIDSRRAAPERPRSVKPGEQRFRETR